MGILEKVLNVCPTTKEVNTEELMDDLFSYCWGLRLKHIFASSNSSISNSSENHVLAVEADTDDERWEMKSEYKNPYFYPFSNYAAPNLEKYIATTNNDIYCTNREIIHRTFP